MYALFNLDNIQIDYDRLLRMMDCEANRHANIVLVGPPGVGKTTIAGRLAKDLNRTFIMADALVSVAVSGRVFKFSVPVDEPIKCPEIPLLHTHSSIIDGFVDVKSDFPTYYVAVYCSDDDVHRRRLIRRNADFHITDKTARHLEQIDQYSYLAMLETFDIEFLCSIDTTLTEV